MSEVGSEKLDSQEVFEEIMSLIHCYSMKLYSKRKIQKIKEVLRDEVIGEAAEQSEESDNQEE